MGHREPGVGVAFRAGAVACRKFRREVLPIKADSEKPSRNLRESTTLSGRFRARFLVGVVELETTAPDKFARACGAHAAVDLRIERVDGLVLAEGQLDYPFAIFGRDEACEITLSDPHVNPRHAILQVVGGRVLLADLGGNPLAVVGPAGGPGFAWLTPTAGAKIGPYHLFLQHPISVAPDPLDLGFNPFQPAPELVARMPRSVIRFLNGRTARAEWQVNRLLTFVGRAPECKISLSTDDIAPFHCYLMLTHAGLWVIDLLSPSGVRVNGEPVRFGRLADGDILEIGRFRLGCWYPDGEPVAPGTEFPTPAGPTRLRAGGAVPGTTPNPPVQPSLPPPPTPDPLDPDFPRRTAPRAPIQYPLSGVLPVLPDREHPPLHDTLPLGFPRTTDVSALMGSEPEPTIPPLPAAFAPGQTDGGIQSMLQALQMFGAIPPQHHADAEAKIAQLERLNQELQLLHDLMAEASLLPTRPDLPADPAQQAVYDRVKEIQAERAGIWERLFALVTGQTGSE